MVAGRVYRAILDEWVPRAMTPPRPGGAAPDVEALFSLELAERLGRWSLRWQEAQDNAAKSLAARYQALSDHLGRMSSLEDGRFLRETGPAAGGPVEPKPPRGSPRSRGSSGRSTSGASTGLFPTFLQSERPLNPLGVAVTPAEQVEIAGRVYRAILDEAVDRFLASPPRRRARPEEVPIFDALLAERLGTGRTSGGRPRTMRPGPSVAIGRGW